jgi:hypothetical protein
VSSSSELDVVESVLAVEPPHAIKLVRASAEQRANG